MQPSEVVAALLGVALVALFLQHADAASAFPPEVKTYTEKEAKKFLKNLNLEWAKKTNTYYLAKWDYETDISKRTLGQEVVIAIPPSISISSGFFKTLVSKHTDLSFPVDSFG